MTPTNQSFEVINGTQRRRGDFNRPEGGEGLHSSPEGVRPHLLPIGCPSPDKTRLVSDLSLGTRRGARQATSDSGSRSPEAYRSLDGPLYDEVLQAELWGEFQPTAFSDTELRVFARRPSKFRRLLWGLETIAHGYWQSFLHWRKHELTECAKSYRALEFAVMFVASAFLFEYCVVLFCREVVR